MVTTQTYKAQILALTLLALLIIAVIVVGVVSLAVRDIQQTTANREYQALYNAAETQIFQLIDKYGNATNPLSQLALDFPTSCTVTTPSKYTCNFSQGTTEVSLAIGETNEVKDFEMSKEESLDLTLNGFRDEIFFSWTGTAALEFTLGYSNSGVNYIIRDQFDVAGIYDSNGGDPLTDPLGTHPFLFTSSGGQYSFRISSTAGLPAAAVTQYLRVTVRRPAAGAIYLDLTGSAGFPNQMREFTSQGYDANTANTIVATAFTQVPITPQAFGFFDYSLLVDGAVSK